MSASGHLWISSLEGSIDSSPGARWHRAAPSADSGALLQTDAESSTARLELLARAGAIFARSLDFDVTLQGIASVAVPALADWCLVDLLEEDGSARRVAVVCANSAKEPIARVLERYPPDLSVAEGVPRTLRGGEPQLMASVTDDWLVRVARNAEHLRALRAVGTISQMVVPLVARGRILGALGFASAESGRRFGPQELALAQSLAGQAALAVDNARLYREAQQQLRARAREEAELRRANRALRALSECNQVLMRADEEDDLLHDVCQVLVEHGGYQLAWVGFPAEGGHRQIRPVARAGREDGYLDALPVTWGDDALGQGPVGRAMRSGLPAVVHDTQIDPEFAHWRERALARGFRSVIALPMTDGSQPLGVLVTYSEETAAFDAQEVAHLSELAGDLAFGIRTLRARAAHRRMEEERIQLLASERAARRLSEGLAIYEATALNLADGLAIVDVDDRLVFWNPRLEALFALRSDEVVGRPLAEVAGPLYARSDDPENAARSLLVAREAAVAGTPSAFEVRLVGPPPRELSTLVFRIMGPGGLLGQGALIRDVTHERELERMKDELVSVVSHELRTPLTALMGFAELLLTRDFEESERRNYLSIILDEGRRLAALINDFLDLQRMESGRQRLRIAPTSLPEVLGHAVAVAGIDPPRPIVLELEDDLPPPPADRDRLLQVLTNLLSNARKFSPAGGQITVSARRAEQAVEIAVIDQGMGIPADALPRLFQKFSRIEGPDWAEIRGTGLGLAICRGIVEAHGGRIWAESAGIGRGSCFRLHLPLSVVAAADDVVVVTSA